ncbi:MAG: class F sortase [Mycobacteriales bacterium]
MRVALLDSRRRVLATTVAIVLVIVGVTLLVVALQAQKSAPQPPRSAAGTLLESTHPPTRPDSSGPPTPSRSSRPMSPRATGTVSSPHRSPSASRPTATHPVIGPIVPINGPVLAGAVPTQLSIPKIGVTSRIMKLGRLADGSIAVPPLSDPHSPAGWYTGSPSPGQLGPSVLLGHVDSKKYGPGVFYNLGKLRPGDTVNVARADGRVAVFRIDGVVAYPKDKFPTMAVYGNIDHAGLRLITCGGTFNPTSGHYENNTIAYASLASSHRT